MKIIAVAMIVMSGMLYQICAKQTSPSINPFASLIVTYCVALSTALILFFSTGRFFGGASLLLEVKKANYASVLLGNVIVAYEIGFILAYRAKYKASELSAHTTVMIMAVMFVIGILFYKETISPKQIIGLVIAAAGIFISIL
jgi:drug/metabolite transporter (DMT)-like permease